MPDHKGIEKYPGSSCFFAWRGFEIIALEGLSGPRAARFVCNGGVRGRRPLCHAWREKYVAHGLKLVNDSMFPIEDVADLERPPDARVRLRHRHLERQRVIWTDAHLKRV